MSKTNAKRRKKKKFVWVEISSTQCPHRVVLTAQQGYDTYFHPTILKAPLFVRHSRPVRYQG